MLFVTLIAVALAVSCNSNNGQFSCNGNDIAMKQCTEESRWQTPPCGADDWKEGYSGMSHVVGCARVQYKDTNRKAATVTVVPTVNPKYNIQKVTDEYNGVASDGEAYEVSESSLPTEDLKTRIRVHMADGSTEYTDLEPLDFVWSIPAANPPRSTRAVRGRHCRAVWLALQQHRE